MTTKSNPTPNKAAQIAKFKEEKRRRRQKKTLFRIILAILAILLCMGIVGVILRACSSETAREIPDAQKWKVKYRPSFDYYFEENIFADEDYMALDRDIKYIQGVQSSSVSLDEDADVGVGNIAFFQSYLRCIIEGRYDDYRFYFDDSYFDEAEEGANYPYPENRFPMQKLYNISLEYLPAEEVIISEHVSKSYYILKYMIKDNTSTFRPELEDESTVAQLVELYTVNGEAKITKLYKYVDN